MNQILTFQPNRVRRIYRGGLLLDQWAGIENPHDDQYPEEWMASVVDAVNKDRDPIPNEGLSITKEGHLLRKLICENPTGMLGAGHVEKYGPSMGVLMKVLDAGERLCIQVHPDKAAAEKLFHSPFGKTEAWYILDVRRDVPANIYVGFRGKVSPDKWKHLFETQDVQGMLNCLNCVPVKPGDVFLIRGGVPHAIGAGCLLAEIQEPTDITIRMEKTMASSGKVPDIMCHNGLGFEKMFDCFDYTPGWEHCRISPTMLEDNENYTMRELISYQDTDAFSMQEIRVYKRWQTAQADRFCLLVVLSGSGTLCAGEQQIPLKQSDYLFVPAECAGISVTAGTETRLLRCFPPR